MRKHKTLGQVYTPDWIVNHILDLAGYTDEKVLGKHIMEPACGDGAFLTKIVSRYIYAAEKSGYDNQRIVTELEEYIYGVEIDEQEYMKAIGNLNQLVSEQLGIDIQVKWKIFQTNTLHFHTQFAACFDFVVGNPPYIRIHNLDETTRQYIKQNFQFSEGTIDIFLCFFEMGLKMLKPTGTLGYITPNSYLHNNSYKDFRTYLKENKYLHTLTDFKANKVFKGFSTYTAITVLQKGNGNNNFEYYELVKGEIKKLNEICFDALNQKDWSFTDKENEKFIESVKQNSSAHVKDYFNVQYGFATLRDKIFIGSVNAHNEKLVIFNGEPVEKEILKKIIKASTYKGDLSSINYILFPYRKVNERFEPIPEPVLTAEFPYAYAYLKLHQEELLKRDTDKGAQWYEFGRSQGIQSMHEEKIVCSTLINGNVSYYKLPADILVYSGIFIVKKNAEAQWEWVENVLKSDDFYKFIRISGKDFSGGYKSITSKQIKEFKLIKE